ncbi:two-component system response regulator [Egbenema bharatensis]|uniref:two-component system response regulator n=1 Tax=Egbenema bharatensis TaxID=3463334 RepID=UPI003A8681B7
MDGNSSYKAITYDILIVDDTPENLRLLSDLLNKKGYHVRKSLNGQSAIRAVQTTMPDLILLDIMMPHMNGFEVCQHLKSSPETASIPIIFLSALNESLDKIKAFQIGGVDYITKPFHFDEVLIRVRNQLDLKEKNDKIHQLNLQLEERVRKRTQQLEASNRELIHEIEERKRIESQLIKMTLHDALTQLPNRVFFMEQLNQQLNQAKVNLSYQFAVLFLDCDRFKVINDSLGHLVGDEVLLAVAQRLRNRLREEDTLARLGGDEFAILLPQVDADRAIQVATCLLTAFTDPFHLSDKREVFISTSIGIALSNLGYEQPEHLLRDADTAMYRAKALGKARYQIFDTEMHNAALHLLQLETDLRRAVEQRKLTLYYQPIVSLQAGRITGVEALLRWQHPNRGMIMPFEFIPVAEETGLILPIGAWVLQEACQQLKHWQQNCIVDNTFTMSINLSVRQFTQTDLIQQIDRVLTATQINPSNLQLEITESVIMESTNNIFQILQQLHDRQIRLSIDDFGTGYSSLSYLHAFPVHSLKIDRSFIQRLEDRPGELGLIPAIISIASTLNMPVVAEGIETLQQLHQLRRLNCDFGQGYFFSQPLPAQKITHLLTSNPQW